MAQPWNELIVNTKFNPVKVILRILKNKKLFDSKGSLWLRYNPTVKHNNQSPFCVSVVAQSKILWMSTLQFMHFLLFSLSLELVAQKTKILFLWCYAREMQSQKPYTRIVKLTSCFQCYDRIDGQIKLGTVLRMGSTQCQTDPVLTSKNRTHSQKLTPCFSATRI